MSRSARFLLAAATATAFWYRQWRGRRLTERLAAASLEALLNAIDANDRQTGAHLRRVAAYAVILARAAGLDEREQHEVERVALFHDIGKIDAALFDIVHDRSTLSPREHRLIATHTERGAEVLRPLRVFYPGLAEGVRSHHERWDGTGYPRELRGDEIPRTARIVAIADTFDAITHHRRYRPAKSFHDAVRAIGSGAGTQFDPSLARRFISRPVLREVRRAMRNLPAAPTFAAADRRTPRGERGPVPDITFRWRPRSPAPPARDREPRRSRESPRRRSRPPR